MDGIGRQQLVYGCGVFFCYLVGEQFRVVGSVQFVYVEIVFGGEGYIVQGWQCFVFGYGLFGLLGTVESFFVVVDDGVDLWIDCFDLVQMGFNYFDG